MVLLLTEADVAEALTVERCLEVVEQAFRDYAHGRGVSRPRTHAYTSLGDGTFYNFKSMDG
jgi:hypothetical protein